MVIQRIQSLYLFIAAVVMIVFTVVIPIGQIGEAPVMLYQLTGALIVSCLAILLSLIDIFLFKNLKLQIRVCKLAMWMVAATEAVIAVCFYAAPEIEYGMPRLIWTVAFPVAAFIFLMLAHKGMKRDKKILTDYDRFR